MGKKRTQRQRPKRAPLRDPNKTTEHLLEVNAAWWWSLLRIYGEGDYDTGMRRFIDLGCRTVGDVYDALQTHEAAAWSYLTSIYGGDAIVAEMLRWWATGIGPLRQQAAKMNQSHDGLLASYSGGTWYDLGMPCLELSPQLAASFMVTSASDAVLSDMRLPFDSFMLRVPHGILSGVTETGKVVHPHTVLVSRSYGKSDGDCFCYVAFAGSSINEMISYFNRRKSLTELLSANAEKMTLEQQTPFEMDLVEVDQRMLRMLERLITGVCLYMTGGGDVESRGCTEWAGHAWPMTGSRSGPPQRRVFKLTQPVVHDFRAAVSDYVSGRGNPLTVQSIVSGHWKRQHHGPGGGQVKTIYIEAYWRGPEDAPIAKRQHILK